MYMCVRVCVYMYMYIICIYIYIHIHVYIHIYIYMYAYICIYKYPHTYLDPRCLSNDCPLGSVQRFRAMTLRSNKFQVVWSP